MAVYITPYIQHFLKRLDYNIEIWYVFTTTSNILCCHGTSMDSATSLTKVTSHIIQH